MSGVKSSKLAINCASTTSVNGVIRVFTSGYTLRPLSAVSIYVDQHGHLPGVPSAAQIAQEGIDLVKMNATLLEKVEELTLYSIQQDKKVAVQQARLELLEKQHKQELAALKKLVNQLLKKP